MCVLVWEGNTHACAHTHSLMSPSQNPSHYASFPSCLVSFPTCPDVFSSFSFLREPGGLSFSSIYLFLMRAQLGGAIRYNLVVTSCHLTCCLLSLVCPFSLLSHGINTLVSYKLNCRLVSVSSYLGTTPLIPKDGCDMLKIPAD